MDLKKAIILCAGYGKRVLPLTKTTPKPLLKINEVPLIEYSIRILTELGVREIAVNVHYLKDKIIDYLNLNKIKAPLTIKRNIKENYIIIEDFGDNLIRKIIQKKKNKFLYFKKIINELVKLQKIKPYKTLPKYSKKLFINELNLFYQWYLPEFFSNGKIKKVKKKIN